MIILTLKTDQEESEIAIYNNHIKLQEVSWLAHRQLADTIHLKINHLLVSQAMKIDDINGIVVFKGPGSFTGLRIGISVANTLAYALKIPIVGVDGAGWQKDGIESLSNKQDDKIVLPNYGGKINITLPNK